ncbi:NADPH oxidase activator [Pistacia vera]|uniref:NADPH oxidase activator n=1 Tax=Pistacia vera TaxID=55513 RepID=UPI001262BD75|nr:NADPH oxidase activator [Pistacia vera]
MADTNAYTRSKLLKTEQNRVNPSKFYTHFLYKALIVSIFLVILPLFPAQAPEFINQTLLTRSWELLHLLFVGIAVSYGLFSHRKDEIEKENNSPSKFENAQTYMSRFLQVSSVFDEEGENLSGSDENKVQTWSNQYYRNEPVVVVANEHSIEQRGTSSRIGEKPLLLPVRSLKSRVPDSNNVESVKETYGKSVSLGRSSSRRFQGSANKAKNGELGGGDQGNLEDKLNENVVLPSPIPWRSRSGRMEMKEDVDSPSSQMFNIPPSVEEHELNRLESRSLRPQVSRSSRSNSTSSSPKLSPSPSLSSPKKSSPSPSLSSSESQAKNSEDSTRKKSFYRPPPPPPPPPPPITHRSSSVKASYNLNNEGSFSEKHFQRRLTDEPKDSSMSRVSSMRKSVRMVRPSDQEFEDSGNVTFDQTSFKTEQLNRESVTYMAKPTFKEFPKQEKEELVDKVIVETDEDSEIEDEEYDDEIGESPFFANTESSSNNKEASSISGNEGPPDVDKKADEFIAKFREQIRLQRIESIKKSSAQIRRNSSR